MAILFRRSNGIYYHITSQNGRRVWRSTGKRTRRDAEKYLRNIALAGQPKTRNGSQTPLFSKFLSEWRIYARANLRPTTVKLYEEAFRSFLRHRGDRALGTYDSRDLEGFKAERLREVSAAKCNIDFACLKALFYKAVEWEVIQNNPCKGVKLVTIPPQRPAYLTKEECARLVNSIEVPWLRDIVTFAVSTMMRAGEIVNLRWESVDLKKRVILVENTEVHRLKTTRPRFVPMNDWVLGYLTRLGPKEGFVFRLPSGGKIDVLWLSHRFKRACRAVGVSERIHFHSLRHTGATWLVQGGASIYAVQKILGHSDVKVTMRYAHLDSAELHSVVNWIRPDAAD